MSTQSKQDERIAKMVFAKVYPYLVDKVEKKGHTVIKWLTGFTEKQLQ